MRTLVACLLLVAGCSSAVAGTGSPPPVTAPPRDQVVYRIGPSVGGFAPAYTYRIARPELTVYGDGTAYVAAAPDGVDGVVALRRGSIPLTTLLGLLDAANRSGLFAGADFGEPHISDVGTTEVALRPDRSAERRVSVYAFGFDDEATGLSDRQRGNRAALRELDRRFAAAVRDAATWSPDRVDVTRVRRSGPSGSGGQDWPGPPLATLLTISTTFGACGTVSGAAAQRLYAAARSHRSITWDIGGHPVGLVVRGLLPGEAACR